MPARTRKQLFVSVDFSGDQELIDALNQAERRAGAQQAIDVLMQAAIAIRDRARSLVRVKTGNLRRAIFASAKNAKRPDGKLAVIAGVSPIVAPHRHLIEYGHGGPHPAPPYPFWRPAVMAEWPVQRAMIMERLREIIKGGA